MEIGSLIQSYAPMIQRSLYLLINSSIRRNIRSIDSSSSYRCCPLSTPSSHGIPDWPAVAAWNLRQHKPDTSHTSREHHSAWQRNLHYTKLLVLRFFFYYKNSGFLCQEIDFYYFQGKNIIFFKKLLDKPKNETIMQSVQKKKGIRKKQ